MIKKNITINFCKRLYAIDEDAYEILSHYTETLRRYYKKDGCEEVADDIEMRIAELMDEKKAAGAHAIDKEMIEGIIGQIGELDELAPEAEETPAGSNGRKGKKSLYRDMEHCIVSGVLSGLANFFGGSYHLWRICFLLLTFLPAILGTATLGITLTKYLPMTSIVLGINFIPVILYMVCVWIMPKAIAPEDRICMRGEEVNPQNLAAELARKPRIVSDSLIYRFFKMLFSLVSIVVGIITVAGLAVFGYCLYRFNMDPAETFGDAFDYYNGGNLSLSNEMASTAATEALAACGYLHIAFIASVVVGLLLLIYSCFHAAISRNSMSGIQKLLLFMAIIACFMTALFSGLNIEETANKTKFKYTEMMKAEKTHDGFYFNDKDWAFFQQNGWKLLKAENLSEERYTYSGEYFDGDKEARYLDAHSWHRNIIYQAEHTEAEVAPGTYTLSCVGRSSEDSHGVFVYVIVENNGEETMYKTEIPGTGHKDIEGEPGNGWVNLAIDGIVVPEGSSIRYGVTTDKAVTGKYCDAEWFSVTDFKFAGV